MIEYLQDLIQNNEFFTGGAILAALSYVGYRLKEIPNRIWNLIRRYCILEVSFDAGSDQFEALAVLLVDKYSKSNSGRFLSIDHSDDSVVIPGGSRWFRHGRCWVNTVMSKRNLENSFSSTSVTFELDIDIYGFNKKEVLQELLDLAMEDMKKSNQELYVRISQSDFWEKSAKLRPRTFDTVFSRHTQPLIEDLDNFINSEERYNKRGIPYRRGILLHGPPGTGKTSMLQAIANHVGRDLRITNLNALSAASIQSLFSRDNMLVAIEDIDCVTNVVSKRESDGDKSDKSDKTKTITLADILNAIDGVTSGHNNILIMTTNFPEKLDAALLRPGRVDVKFELGYMNQEEFDEMVDAYYGVEAFPVPEGLTPAVAQGAMQQNQESFEGFRRKILEVADV